VYQAGTLSGNPLAMAAGMATVSYLLEHRDEVYPLLESRSNALANGILSAAAEAGIPMTANRVGAMFTWFFCSGSVKDYASAAKSDTAAFARFHRGMLEQGIWLPCSQFEAAFLSTTHTAEDIQTTIEASKTVLASAKESMLQP